MRRALAPTLILLLLAGCTSAPNRGTAKTDSAGSHASTTTPTTTPTTGVAPNSLRLTTPAPSSPRRTSRPSPSAGHRAGAATPARRSASTAKGASIAGCPLFPADNAWRRDISRTPVSPHSAAWVASVGAGGFLHPDFGSNPSYGIPYSVVTAGQAKVPVTFTAYGDESNPGPYPIPADARIESGGDAHVLVASGNCHLYELYGAARTAHGWTAQSGAIFDLESDKLRPAGWTSADAAGLPILPGLVRRSEIDAGSINHALRFTVARTQRGYIHPATHAAGSTGDSSVPPMGARFRLKSSFDLRSYHGAALVILRALKRYGMFVADNGSNWYLSGATDSGWNDTDLDQLKRIPGSAFEVVDSGAIHQG